METILVRLAAICPAWLLIPPEPKLQNPFMSPQQSPLLMASPVQGSWGGLWGFWGVLGGPWGGPGGIRHASSRPPHPTHFKWPPLNVGIIGIDFGWAMSQIQCISRHYHVASMRASSFRGIARTWGQRLATNTNIEEKQNERNTHLRTSLDVCTNITVNHL